MALSYDPLGRLFALTPQGGAATRFAHDYGEIIGEFSAANALLVRYVKGAGADETLVAYAGAGTAARTFLHADERGSIIARTDNTGTPLGPNTYDAYGRPGASNAGRFQYTGQAWMPELGLYYYKARFYHPKLGRFIQTDPIGYAAGLNLYAYVGGDPVNWVDSSGLRPDLPLPGEEEIVVFAERFQRMNQEVLRFLKNDSGDNLVRLFESIRWLNGGCAPGDSQCAEEEVVVTADRPEKSGYYYAVRAAMAWHVYSTYDVLVWLGAMPGPLEIAEAAEEAAEGDPTSLIWLAAGPTPGGKGGRGC